MQTGILYHWLGLQDENNKSDAIEIREAYRRLAVLYHPERTGDIEDSRATRRWQEVQLAYQILGDDETRKKYEQGLIDDAACRRCLDSKKHHQARQELQVSLGAATQHNIKRVARTYQNITADDLPFFFHAAYYVFFESSIAAQSHRPLRSANIPVHIYVTTAALGMLSARIQKMTQMKPVFKPQTEDSPAHLVLKTNYPPALERLIDSLMLENILFEQYEPSLEGQKHAPVVNF